MKLIRISEMKILQTNIVILLLALCAFLPANAEDYVFRSLSVSNGLSDLLVNAIYKDSKGYVWLGTGTSLDRFDGERLKRYAVTGSNEKLKRVNALAETADGQLWMGNGMGLWRMDRQADALVPVAASEIEGAVHALAADAGRLYVGTDKGLFILQPDGTLDHVLTDANAFTTANHVKGICLADDQRLWLATEGGLYAYRLDNRTMTAYPAPRADGSASAFHSIARVGSTLYLGTMDRGIVAFDIHSSRFKPYVDVGCNVISSLSTNGGDMLYVGTDGNGICFIDTRRGVVTQSFRHASGGTQQLRSNSVYSLLVDRDGLIWVGYYQNGVDYTLYQNRLFATYAFPPLIDTKDMPIRALHICEGRKLIGTRDGLHYIDENRRIVRTYRTPQMRAAMVFCICHYAGEFYVGTYGGGLYILDPATLQLRDFSADTASPLRHCHVFCLTEDAAGNLWMGTSDGLFCYRDGQLTAHYTNANSQLPGRGGLIPLLTCPLVNS